ncbi:uncharacterized protein LOC111117723 [Crassostrea virginica]
MADPGKLSDDYSYQMLPNTFVHVIAGAFGVFGNALVLFVYSRYIQDNSGTRYFIPILAFVDFVGCVSNVTQFHLDNTMRYIYPNVYLCKVLSFLMIMTGGFSAHLILVIALQRYMMICRPLAQQMNRKYCRIAIAIICIISAGYASPVLKFGGLYDTYVNQMVENSTRKVHVSICHFDDGTNGWRVMVPYFGTLLLLSFINIIVTSGLYIPVTKTIYRTLSPGRGMRASRVLEGDTNMTSRETQSTSVERFAMVEMSRQSIRANGTLSTTLTTPASSREQRARKNISVMFLVIIIVYVVSYLTSLVTQIHSFATGIPLEGYRLNIYFFCLRFNLLNHIANPYIYWFYDIKFRQEVCRFCCHGHRDRYSFSA